MKPWRPQTPVVSTTIGAEGLEVHPPREIRIADTPEAFAAECIALMNDPVLARSQALEAWHLVAVILAGKMLRGNLKLSSRWPPVLLQRVMK